MFIDNFYYRIAETFTLVNYKLMIIIKRLCQVNVGKSPAKSFFWSHALWRCSSRHAIAALRRLDKPPWSCGAAIKSNKLLLRYKRSSDCLIWLFHTVSVRDLVSCYRK